MMTERRVRESGRINARYRRERTLCVVGAGGPEIIATSDPRSDQKSIGGEQPHAS